ncbi:hypothetical protein [Halorussus salinisoli]|uniref:hypothetical protein n=1 Tax=Halorussus salinisoli TaxID=2558242 RepID=UPI0014852D84|nr:hypothetical protein [Halorussus salinisoli]
MNAGRREFRSLAERGVVAERGDPTDLPKRVRTGRPSSDRPSPSRKILPSARPRFPHE